jgi:hypothetical protein
MAKRYTDEFRRDAVRMATTSGLTRPQLSSDLGVGGAWIKWRGSLLFEEGSVYQRLFQFFTRFSYLARSRALNLRPFITLYWREI